MSILDLAGAIPEWMERAACRQSSNPDAWFPHTGSNNVDAAAPVVALCHSCPVREQCLAYAVEHDIEHGIWGGKLERERRLDKNPPSTTVCNRPDCDAPIPQPNKFRRRYCSDQHRLDARAGRRTTITRSCKTCGMPCEVSPVGGTYEYCAAHGDRRRRKKAA